MVFAAYCEVTPIQCMVNEAGLFSSVIFEQLVIFNNHILSRSVDTVYIKEHK